MEKVLNKKPINIIELHEEIKKIKKRDEELNFRAGKVEEYLNHFAHLSMKEAEDLIKKLEDLKIPRIKEKHIHKLIDTLPKTSENVKLVLNAYPITVNSKNCKKIADVIAKNTK